MREIIMMLERELSNDGLIYIYRESDGKWYAYEQSAFYLSRMMLELSLDRYVMENALWMKRNRVYNFIQCQLGSLCYDVRRYAERCDSKRDRRLFLK